ncbi:vascular endothelial growth factor A-like isoform X4 [Erpetoichthys calabaricus]|uniref:vascular endothelial growth factor A-like isoform X4 n=1 Tax=Erpetoichthys calabaricus TaxID=27687 RepID=UPI00109F38C3|nr:vascular endothelial growth factor A-like isoform X4 [Erpetoichthys calabaricus]
MNFILSVINLVLAFVLYLSTVKSAYLPENGERRTNEVIQFLEVFERSYCRTIETLVDIFQEYPDEVEYIFKPSCVPLMRCAGCCNDESLECVPTETYNVTMQVMRMKFKHGQHVSEMSFTEHSRCECRPKQDVREKKEKKFKKSKGKVLKRKRKKSKDKNPSSHCEPCSERRKHLFVQDPHTCKCSCKFTQLRCKSKQLELNERTCRCERPR